MDTYFGWFMKSEVGPGHAEAKVQSCANQDMINTLIVSALCVTAGLLNIPVVILGLEVVTAIPLSKRRPVMRHGPRPRLAVLVPAHNESSGLLPTLADIETQSLPAAPLLVLAPNCTDDPPYRSPTPP